MTHADIARQAGAACIAAAAHCDPDEEWPCSGHLLAAYSTTPAPASSSSSAVRRSAGGDDGAAGVRAPVPPSGQGVGGSTTQTDHRPGTLNPEPAYRPNVLGQKQV